MWTGFDYRGEPTPYAWPCINSHFGVLDTCGFPKDNFYYYQSWWTTNLVLHLLPHWNWPGKEGQEIRVDALSNCEEVELFLNGESLGKQPMKRNSKLSWQVKYAPGDLSAKGFNGGKVVAETKVETTGEPAAVQLTPDRAAINADGEDVSVIHRFRDGCPGPRGAGGAETRSILTWAARAKSSAWATAMRAATSRTRLFPTSRSNIAGEQLALETRRRSGQRQVAPEYATEFDDSTWNLIKPKTDGDTGDHVLEGARRRFSVPTSSSPKPTSTIPACKFDSA